MKVDSYIKLEIENIRANPTNDNSIMSSNRKDWFAKNKIVFENVIRSTQLENHKYGVSKDESISNAWT